MAQACATTRPREAASSALLAGVAGQGARRCGSGPEALAAWPRLASGPRGPTSAGSRPSCTGWRAGCCCDWTRRAADAEAAFDEAIAVAREQAARMWELRAARDLARLWAERASAGRRDDLLAPIYGWFTEGFDTPDLEEAGRCSTPCVEPRCSERSWRENDGRDRYRLASEDPGAAQPPLRLDDLERVPVPRRRHRHRHLRQVRHHLGAADRGPAHLRRCRGPRGRRDVALARPPRAAQGGEAARGRGADAPAVPQDPPAGRRPRLLAEGQVHLHRPRRARRGLELLQPPRQRQRALVPGAQRHAGPGRPADRPAAGLDPPVLPRLARRRRLPVVAVLGEHQELVGDPPPAERDAAALRRAQGRPAGADPAHRHLPRHPGRREPLARRSSSIAASTT